jgi:hypothetical protein
VSSPGLNHGAEQAIGAVDVVVNRIAFVLGRLHRIGSGALLSKVHDGLRLNRADQCFQLVVVFGDIEVDEFYWLPLTSSQVRMRF